MHAWYNLNISAQRFCEILKIEHLRSAEVRFECMSKICRFFYDFAAADFSNTESSYKQFFLFCNLVFEKYTSDLIRPGKSYL